MAIKKKKKKKPLLPGAEQPAHVGISSGGEPWFGTADTLNDPSSQKGGNDPLAGRNLLTGAHENPPGGSPHADLSPADAFVQAIISGDREQIKEAYADLGMKDAPAIKAHFVSMPVEQRKAVTAVVDKNKDLFDPIAYSSFKTMMVTAPAPPKGAKPLNFEPVALEGDEALAAMGGAGGKYVAPVSGTVGNTIGADRGGGRHHSGVDFRAPSGTKAVAVIGGTVTHVGNDPGGYDHYAIVQGNDGNVYRYATHAGIDVKVGQKVDQGQAIGTIGRGHLHFEVAQPGDPGFKSLKAGGATQWWGKAARPTSDPLKVLGLSPQSKFAAGQPVGMARPETAADVPASADPFGVERMHLTAAGVPDGTNMDSLPAGMRNFNPGNLKYSGSAWQKAHFSGMVGPSENTDQGDPQIKFASALDGMKAAATLARTKYDGGATTVRALIAGKNGWTPGYDPAAVNIAATMGVGPDDPIDLSKPEVMASFLRGVVTQEHGPSSKLYSDALIHAAVTGGAEIAGAGGQDVVAGGAKSVGGAERIAKAIQASGGLRKGSRNTEANKAVQAFLVDQAVGDRIGAPIKPDGVFGNRTKEAVKNYQARNGLRPDGVVGKDTFAQMNADMAPAENAGPELVGQASPDSPFGVGAGTMPGAGSRYGASTQPDYGKRDQWARRGFGGINAGPELIGNRNFAAGAAAAAVTVDPVVSPSFGASAAFTLGAVIDHKADPQTFAQEREWDAASARIAGTLRDNDRMAAEARAATGKAGKTDFAPPIEASAAPSQSFADWLGPRTGDPIQEHQVAPEEGLAADARRAWDSVRHGFDVETWLSAPTAQDSPLNSGSSDPFRSTGGYEPGGSNSGSDFDSFASGMSSTYQSVAGGGSVFSGGGYYGAGPSNSYEPGGSNTSVTTDAAGRVLGGI